MEMDSRKKRKGESSGTKIFRRQNEQNQPGLEPNQGDNRAQPWV